MPGPPTGRFSFELQLGFVSKVVQKCFGAGADDRSATALDDVDLPGPLQVVERGATQTGACAPLVWPPTRLRRAGRSRPRLMVTFVHVRLPMFR